MNISVTLDTETFPNCFLLVARIVDTELTFVFEISDFKNDGENLYWFLRNIKTAYGFNLVGFDGPVIHLIMQMQGKVSASIIYEKAMAIIDSQDEDRFTHMVFPSDRTFEWVCLYKIHHMDNRARSTSLKALEFAMRMDNISDLPFPVGTHLNQQQIKVLSDYCIHDVSATELFRIKSIEAIKFRRLLGDKYKRDFMNKSDVSIGTEIFQVELEKKGVQTYEYGTYGRKPRQTNRERISLRECIPTYIKFTNTEFGRVHRWLSEQVITETKGVFDNLTAVVDGVEYSFGTGGLHGAVPNATYGTDNEWLTVDWDCISMYPSIAISNRYYPDHLGMPFVEVYEWLKSERIKHKKGTIENAAYKLALNGTFGKANDKFSVFYDPQFLLKVTLTGQLCLAMLIERLTALPNVHVMSANTDGVCVKMKKEMYDAAKSECDQWEKVVGLQLEEARYSKMFQLDCNNYIAEFVNGSVKRKGAFEYDLSWHQNGSFLVIPKVAEQVLIYGKPIRETVMNWPDRMDFMGRVKVPRNSKLVGVADGVDTPLENTQRYYVSKGGVQLVKIMPPTAKKPDVWRRIGVESGWTVCPCNDLRDAVLSIDYEYYISEVEKLCLSVM